MKLKDQSLFNDISNKLNKIIFKKLTNNKSIFFAGNGGSASISNHAVCDFLKNYKIKTKLKKIYSLSSNIELITAISNDYSYEKIFEFQIDKLSSKGDLLILISSSGNSENIIKAARLAIKKKVEIFSLVGFDGGRLKKISKNHYHVNSKNYGICEDLHMSLLHNVIDLNNKINR